MPISHQIQYNAQDKEYYLFSQIDTELGSYHMASQFPKEIQEVITQYIKVAEFELPLIARGEV